MINKLKNITSIQTGLFTKPIKKGKVQYLQPRHINKEGQLIYDFLPSIRLEDIKDKHLLYKNDILFVSKGSRNPAVIHTSDTPAVASTSFFVIRPTDEQILPQYLHWFINHPKTQRLLKSKSKGSAIPAIPKSALADLELPIPTIEEQKTILKIAELQNKHKKLHQKIIDLKEKQIQQIIFNKINA